ncbi:MAG: RagB/SusD family nutrient uptake outer membrane protein [Bacteroidetes bacterium]|nr:RagB/SusD family nutrient uptake outer membrane protein [Bacteroidota bacterium]
MKIIKIYSPLLLLMWSTFFVTGCKKYLSNDPQENKYNASSVNYSDLGTMYQPVSGVYRTAGGENPGFAHWMDFGIRGVRGDDLDKGSSASDQSTLTDIKYFHNDYSSVQSFWGTNNCWNDYYGLVIDCNGALGELDKFAAHIQSSDAANLALYHRYTSEVRFIRAFAHLIISRVFGDVPVLTDNTQISGIGKSSFSDVRKFIMSEMNDCIPQLEDAAPNTASHIGSVTKYSALLLKAKAAADLAGSDNGSAYWDTVLTCTNQIISSNKFSLYPNYYQLFKLPGKMCNESLFELQYSDFGTSTGDNVMPGAFWAFQGPRGDQHGSAISGWGFMNPSQSFVNFLKSRNDNIRLQTTILYCDTGEVANRWGAPSPSFNGNKYGVTMSNDTIWNNSDGCKYYNGKAYLPSSQMTAGRSDYGSNNNVRVLRYADVLLLNAEAKIRKGQSGDAELNLVRSRVGLSSITGANVQNVIDERRAEFGCEWWGERYNDLLRTGTAATILSGFGFVPGTSDYIPIPQTQIDLDQNLK